MHYVIKFKNFLTKEECDLLNDWADIASEKKWMDCGLDPSVEGWSYNKRVTTRNYGDRFIYPKLAYYIHNRITEKLNLYNLRKGVHGGGKDGIVVSLTYPEGDVYEHVDGKEPMGEVLRCNILTRPPESGGDLYINNSKINIELGELHCYLPSTIKHRVTKITGNVSRVIWMFSYQISLTQFNEIVNLNKDSSKVIL